MATKDWLDWHADYDEPGSSLAGRLVAVQDRIREALDRTAPGPVRVVSMCAGQGRDLLGVLADHPRRADVHARLVELDPRNAELAGRAASAAGLDRVEVVVGDATVTTAYDGAVPADLVLVCGVFGHASDDDIHRIIDHLPSLCAAWRHGGLDQGPLRGGPAPDHPRLVHRGRLRGPRPVDCRQGRSASPRASKT